MNQQDSDTLRHMTSSGGLTAKPNQRAAGHLRTTDARLGSRSPASIPSSPTSVHSSSSAIFERDIEPLPTLANPVHSNPHRTARAKGTEQLELSVPSVLDSAATILADADASASDHISVLTPAVRSNSGFASPIGSFRSRSPSPLGARTALLIPSASPPSIIAPSPTSSSPTASPAVPAAPLPTSHPPSPSNPSNKRLSFISYSDLLSSAPHSTHPLSALTTSATAFPPPHLPALHHAAHSHPGSTTPSIHSISSPANRISLVSAELLGLVAPETLDDSAGGEWVREGLGMGLEERLDALLGAPVPVAADAR